MVYPVNNGYNVNERVTNYGDFTDLLQETDVIDNRYPVKGCGVWMPYGFHLKTRCSTT